jgi:DNA-binding CsgD family transcriptional regulator
MLVESEGKPQTSTGLLGRGGECAAIDEMIEAVRGGESRTLVIRGEPGVGKTALLDYAADRAPGRRVARAAGVQAEIEFAFAGLHQLCMPMLHRLDVLPAPQRDALRAAFGMHNGGAPDRFLVGLAVLGLLSDMAADQPLVCVVDDAQWLDQGSAQALAFVARRLFAESVAIVFAVREPSEERNLAGLPEILLEGLSDDDARALLASVIRSPLDERVRDRIIAETRGNPLALLELPRGLTPASLAGGFGLPDALQLSGRIEESFLQRIECLPAATRQVLLIAAAEPVGDPALLWRAADALGIGVGAAAPADAAGLVKFGARVVFHHPLVRSAVYRAATTEERQLAHRTLADALDPELDPDRRAWHRARAAVGPDEEVAEELERSAGRAEARGGLAAAAAFLERATTLTVDPELRVERALAAAHVKFRAGIPDAALSLLVTAEAGPLDELQRARVDLLGAQIAASMARDGDAVRLLIHAAKQFEPLDATIARETYLDAFSAATSVGQVGSRSVVLDIARAVSTAPVPAEPLRGADLLLDGLALQVTGGPAAGLPLVQEALRALHAESASGEDVTRWLWLAAGAARSVWDDGAWVELAAHHVQITRDAGALTMLPMALASRIAVHIHSGDLSSAVSLIDEMRAVTQVRGGHLPAYMDLTLAAWRGREAEFSDLITAIDPRSSGDGAVLAVAPYAAAVLYNGLGRYEEALAAAEAAARDAAEPGVAGFALAELVEAAARSGRIALAAAAFESLAAATQASGTDWALGVEARSCALLREGDEAESLYREAIERLGRSRIAPALARAHLLYGEWLRRRRRRLDARDHLRIAHQMSVTMGLEAFAQRAERELVATGETARRRDADTVDDLTAQETQIAELARGGLSNPEIGAQLFISPRTVEYHLHKVFGKLGIRSRNQLDGALVGEVAAQRA